MDDLITDYIDPTTCTCDSFPDATTCHGNYTNSFISFDFQQPVMLSSVDLKSDLPLNASSIMIRLEMDDSFFWGERDSYAHNVENVMLLVTRSYCV